MINNQCAGGTEKRVPVVVRLLKRHPYAAILAVLLLLCTFVDWTSWTMSGSPRSERYFGLSQGHFNGAQYTAIVRGVGGTTGVAVVEVFALN